jgi:hypothetical protein
MKKSLLFLDDIRNPYNIKSDWLKFSPIGYNVEIIWVKNYYEFIEWIEVNGLPDAIYFDHDLGIGNTGYDCAKWLVDFCMDNNFKLPIYNIQSSNSVGIENIDMLFKNYIKYVENVL